MRISPRGVSTNRGLFRQTHSNWRSLCFCHRLRPRKPNPYTEPFDRLLHNSSPRGRVYHQPPPEGVGRMGGRPKTSLWCAWSEADSYLNSSSNQTRVIESNLESPTRRPALHHRDTRLSEERLRNTSRKGFKTHRDVRSSFLGCPRKTPHMLHQLHTRSLHGVRWPTSNPLKGFLAVMNSTENVVSWWSKLRLSSTSPSSTRHRRTRHEVFAIVCAR
jgi:hypothetical protein